MSSGVKSGDRLRLAELHWPVITIVVAIALLGVYNLSSAAAARDPDLYLTQFYWMLFAGLITAGTLFIDYRITESLAYPVFVIVCLLLVGVLAQGRIAKGAERWLDLGFVSIQPSEFAKLATVLCLARYFGDKPDSGGYTIGSLVRPLNPSRPLAVIAGLLVFRNKPFVVDPIGELARLLRKKLGGLPPPPHDLLWFRVLLILAILALAAIAVLVIIRWERRVELLNTWPPGRRKRLIVLTLGVALTLLVGLAWVRNQPFVRDPFGVTISYLVASAGAGATHEHLHPGNLMRALLGLGALAYLVASLRNMRVGAGSLSELIIAPFDLVLLPAGLILVQPDLGTAGIVILVGMVIILVVGVRLRSLVILGLFGAVIAAVGWFGILKEYQKNRILTFIDPEHDTQGAGWNAVQSMIAVGSGQWFGKGHKGGTQTQLSFLPEQHTDFAFSVWSEEQGFIGCAVVVTLYCLLILFAISIAADARERYGALLAAGCAAIIMWQAFINLSMVMGMFPVVGITLPLFSYGGSSVLTVMMAVGILLNVHWRRRVH